MPDPATASFLAENTRKTLDTLRGGSAVIQFMESFLRPVTLLSRPPALGSTPIERIGTFPRLKSFISKPLTRGLSPTPGESTKKGFEADILSTSTRSGSGGACGKTGPGNWV